MQGKDVLLINPWIYDFAAYDLWAKPQGLLGIGAVLRKNGCRVSFIDCLKSPHPCMGARPPKTRPGGHGKYYRKALAPPEKISDIPRGYGRYGIDTDAFLHDLSRVRRPDAVLVTSLMTYWYPGVFEVIRRVKEAFPGTPVLLGGVYATLCREHALRFSNADYVIAGEGEIQALEVLCRLWGTSPRFIPDREDLDSLPYPLFDLVDPLRYVCIQTSRGCPNRCSYCASHLMCATMRRRDPVRVADEIEYWVKAHGAQDVAFYDDALLFRNESFAIPMMKEIIRRGLEVRFHCPNALHARYIGPETARAMKESGFATIRLGLETTSVSRQIGSGNKVTSGEFVKAFENLVRAGFDASNIGVYILCGLPYQRFDEVMQTIRFVQDLGAKPLIAEYSPLPGTGEWEKACAVSRYPLTEDPLYQNNTLIPCAWEGLTYEMYREIKRAL